MLYSSIEKVLDLQMTILLFCEGQLIWRESTENTLYEGLSTIDSYMANNNDLPIRKTWANYTPNYNQTSDMNAAYALDRHYTTDSY